MSAKAPNCVGIIMDGNRRFAKERGLPAVEGHRYGGEKLKEVISWARDAGIKHLIFYTFSTENWNRSEYEVSFLLNLIGEFFNKELEQFHKEGGVLHFAGDLTKFSPGLQEMFRLGAEKTKNNPGPHIYFALNYGGRAEILSAVRAALKDAKKPEEITEEMFSKYMQTYPLPDVDLIVRTSGEQRLSGFLPWQGVYAEIYFTPTHWPALSKEEFLKILEWYENRERRFGK